MKVYAIIPAGGQSKRLGGQLPKQYHKINGKELIAYTLEVFQSSPLIDQITIAAQSDYFDLLSEIGLQYGITKLAPIVEGGAERQDSVYNALMSLKAHDSDLVAVHDAARPLLSTELLNTAVSCAENTGTALVAISARDTLVKGGKTVDSYIDRNGVFYAQTPQIFRYSILKDAMEKAREHNFMGTDESMLVRRAGYPVRIVEGSSLNFKVTTQDDMELFSKLTGLI